MTKKLVNSRSTFENIVRITYILPDAKDFKQCWPTLKKYLGNIKPAATMFYAKLADEKMKIEIQVTALKANNT